MMTNGGVMEEEAGSRKKPDFRDKNHHTVRGEIISDILQCKGGFSFTVRTSETHKGRKFPTDHHVLASSTLTETLNKAKIGDIVEIEGPVTQNRQTLVKDFVNFSQLARESAGIQDGDIL